MELPQLTVSQVISRRDKLSKTLTPFLGHKIVGPTFQSLVDELCRGLPHGILRDTVLSSVKSLLREELTADRAVATCWRLAGNIERLKDHIPVPEWSCQLEAEWVPAQITDTKVFRKSKRLEYRIQFLVLAGTATNVQLTQRWSHKKLQYLATYRDELGRGFGFGKHKLNKRGEELGKLLFMDVKQFFGLRCFLLLDPERSKDEPFATEIKSAGSTMAYNRELLRARDREYTPCVKGLPNKQECFNCPYGKDFCEYATHSISYRVGTCPRCDKQGFFDPADKMYSSECLTCAYKQRTAYEN
jgi:hypothetical protein